MLSNFLSKYRRIKIERTYNSIIITGLVAYLNLPKEDFINNIGKIRKSEIVPENYSLIKSMSHGDFRELATTHLPVFLHNCIVSKDFPAKQELVGMLLDLERALKSIEGNPWLSLLYEAGLRNDFPNPNEWELSLGPLDKAALAFSRQHWEETTQPLLDSMTNTIVSEKDSIYTWLETKASKFEV